MPEIDIAEKLAASGIKHLHDNIGLGQANARSVGAREANARSVGAREANAGDVSERRASANGAGGSSDACWYALTVRHQHERRTAQSLSASGWETLVPLYRTKRQWSDRVKDIDLPLFAGYVFCRFAAQERIRVEDTPGVASIVEFSGRPAPLSDGEIEEIRRIVTSPLPLSPWPYLMAGDAVRLERGPLKGLEGTLVRHRDQYRLVVGVELLQRSIAVEVSPDMITPLRALSAAR